METLQDKSTDRGFSLGKLLDKLIPIAVLRHRSDSGQNQADIHQSPFSLLLIIAVLFYISGAAARFAVSFLPEMPAQLGIAIYLTLLLLLFSPGLYLLLLRPLTFYAAANQKIENQQREFNKSQEQVVIAREKRNWLSKGQVGLSERLRGDQDVADLSRNVISYLASYLNTRIGILYLLNQDNILSLSGSYAYVKPKNGIVEFRLGEGLVGQAAMEKRSFVVTDVPDFYIRENSEWGEPMPQNILVMPFLYRGTVIGVIELASFQKFTDTQVELLNLVSEQIATAFNTVQSMEQVRGLLNQTQTQAEELQVQQEELKTANEELEERSNPE